VDPRINRRGLDRTIHAVTRQIAVMGSTVFEVGLFKRDPSAPQPVMVPRAWDADTLLWSVTWLRRERPITLTSIREAVREIDGISISTNTIQRNELAYEVYLNYAPTALRKTSRCRARAVLQRAARDGQGPALRAKIARLRRQPKDHLIARLLELERTTGEQVKRENALRERFCESH
jgi:hypothetical protein